MNIQMIPVKAFIEPPKPSDRTNISRHHREPVANCHKLIRPAQSDTLLTTCSPGRIYCFMFQTQEITFSEYAIDVLVINNLPAYAKRKVLLRPLRIAPDGQVSVLYQEKVYPLYLDSEGKVAIFLSGAVFKSQNTIRPAAIPLTTKLRFIEAPLQFKFSTDSINRLSRSCFCFCSEIPVIQVANQGRIIKHTRE